MKFTSICLLVGAVSAAAEIKTTEIKKAYAVSQCEQVRMDMDMNEKQYWGYRKMCDYKCTDAQRAELKAIEAKRESL